MIEKDTNITKVVFRKFKDGELIALFPYEVAGNSPVMLDSYMWVGQHGAASMHIVAETKLATKNEYYDLKRHLEELGYNLKVLTRIPRKAFIHRAKFFQTKKAG